MVICFAAQKTRTETYCNDGLKCQFLRPIPNQLNQVSGHGNLTFEQVPPDSDVPMDWPSRPHKWFSNQAVHYHLELFKNIDIPGDFYSTVQKWGPRISIF